MDNQEITLEIPAGVTQKDVWKLGEDLQGTPGVAQANLNLQEQRDPFTAAVIIIGLIPVAVGYVKQGVTTLADFKEAAKKLHEFLHPADKKSEADEAARQKVALLQPDGNIQLWGYSEQELETLLDKIAAQNQK